MDTVRDFGQCQMIRNCRGNCFCVAQSAHTYANNFKKQIDLFINSPTICFNPKMMTRRGLSLNNKNGNNLCCLFLHGSDSASIILGNCAMPLLLNK